MHSVELTVVIGQQKDWGASRSSSPPPKLKSPKELSMFMSPVPYPFDCCSTASDVSVAAALLLFSAEPWLLECTGLGVEGGAYTLGGAIFGLSGCVLLLTGATDATGAAEEAAARPVGAADLSWLDVS